MLALQGASLLCGTKWCEGETSFNSYLFRECLHSVWCRAGRGADQLLLDIQLLLLCVMLVPDSFSRLADPVKARP